MESQKKIGDLDEFTLDFDQISEEFLFMILDTLEFFEAYQLCIVVCNRYHLKEKIGWYLISVANKYSNLRSIGQ